MRFGEIIFVRNVILKSLFSHKCSTTDRQYTHNRTGER